VPFSEAINDDKPPPTCHSANSNLRGNLKGKKRGWEEEQRLFQIWEDTANILNASSSIFCLSTAMVVER